MGIKILTLRDHLPTRKHRNHLISTKCIIFCTVFLHLYLWRHLSSTQIGKYVTLLKIKIQNRTYLFHRLRDVYHDAGPPVVHPRVSGQVLHPLHSVPHPHQVVHQDPSLRGPVHAVIPYVLHERHLVGTVAAVLLPVPRGADSIPWLIVIPIIGAWGVVAVVPRRGVPGAVVGVPRCFGVAG